MAELNRESRPEVVSNTNTLSKISIRDDNKMSDTVVTIKDTPSEIIIGEHSPTPIQIMTGQHSIDIDETLPVTPSTPVTPTGISISIIERWKSLTATPVKKGLLFFNGISIILAIAVIIYFVIAMRQLDNAYDDVLHTNEVQSLISDIRLTQTQRLALSTAYLVTGNSSYIPTIIGYNSTIYTKLDQLYEQTYDNNVQQQNIIRLYPYLEENARLANNISVIYKSDQAISLTTIALIPIHRNIIIILMEMNTIEQDLLKYRKASRDTTSNIIIIITPVAVSLVVLSLAIGLWFGIDSETRSIRRNNEKLRLLLDKAKEASEAKSAFLSNMSHEIRTPMNGVLTMVKILLESDLTFDQTDIAKTILFSAEHMMKLINDILFISKVESGKMEVKKERVKIQNLISPLTNIYGAKCRQKNIKFVCNLQQDIPPMIVIDHIKLAQVISNLLDNAIKFTDNGSIILDVLIKNNNLMIKISDTGIGIAQESIHSLFQPFSQINTGSTRRYEGTGLGLSICYQIIKSMGGDISVSSVKHIGSTFEFYIPVEIQSPSSNTRNNTLYNSAKSKTRILEIEPERKTNSPIRNMRISIERVPPFLNSPIKNINITPADTPIVLDAPFGNSSILLSNITKVPNSVKLNILVAEDNIINQKVIGRLLDKQKHSFELVGNGQLAMELYIKNPKKYDIILMDIHMPVMDGLTSTTLIREFEVQQNIPKIPIVGVTASAMVEEDMKCLRAGISDVIHKPVDSAELKEKIFHHCLAGKL